MSNLGNKQTMAKNLSYYVERSGKSKRELAEIVGVAPSTFNEWTKGNKYPRIDKIERLANYFGILKSDLIEERTEEQHVMIQKHISHVDLLLRLRSDNEFASIVEGLNKLDANQLASIKQLVDTFLITSK